MAKAEKVLVLRLRVVGLVNAGEEGFEPSSTVLETVILPLKYSPGKKKSLRLSLFMQ